MNLTTSIPDGTGLEVSGSTRENGSGDRLAGLAAIHDTLGHGRELPANAVSHVGGRRRAGCPYEVPWSMVAS